MVEDYSEASEAQEAAEVVDYSIMLEEIINKEEVYWADF